MFNTMWLKRTGVAAIGLLLFAVAGCQEDKVTTVERSEEVRESEPRMVSPGQEVVVPDE